MGDTFYNIFHRIGHTIMWVSSRPMILHRERSLYPGGYILASSHMHPIDVPCMMYGSLRHLDFMSTREIFRIPIVAWLFRGMNTFALNRGRPDPVTVRECIDRLARGRALAMFPEGRVQTGPDSVVAGGRLLPGVAGIAWLAKAPVIPCVVLGAHGFNHWTCYLPLRKVRWGMIFGKPIVPRTDLPEDQSREQMLSELYAAYPSLYAELRAAMPTDPRPASSNVAGTETA